MTNKTIIAVASFVFILISTIGLFTSWIALHAWNFFCQSANINAVVQINFATVLGLWLLLSVIRLLLKNSND